MINIFLDKYSSFINLSSSTPLYLHFLLLIHIKRIAFSITFIQKAYHNSLIKSNNMHSKRFQH